MILHSPLIIRADADQYIGSGHVMRCVALAQAWEEVIQQPISLITTALPVSLIDRIENEKIKIHFLNLLRASVEDAEMTRKIAQRSGAEWVVIDGYSFDRDYQERILETGVQLLVVNDFDHSQCAADLILNQNIYAEPCSYWNCSPGVRMLLGPRYALLRREFWDWRNHQRKIEKNANKILVTFGGADPGNFTARIVKALGRIRQTKLEITIVIGPSYRFKKDLEKSAFSVNHSVQILQNVKDMAHLMAWADLALCAAGSTTLEMAYMGLPTIIGVIAKNQNKVAESLGEANVAVNIGDISALSIEDLVDAISELLEDQQYRYELSRLGQQLVDGKGSRRVIKHMITPKVLLRPATWDDRHILWNWANEPSVRAASFSQDPIPWKNHISWLRKNIDDNNAYLFMGILANGERIGIVRYLVRGSRAVVSVSLDPNWRGKGIGSRLITEGSRALQKTANITVIDAFIKKQNQSSLNAFQIAGFKILGETKVKNQNVWQLRQENVQV